VRADARLKITRDSHRSETYCLTLNLVKEEDSGDYEVKATNSMGTATSMSRVFVQSKYYSTVGEAIEFLKIFKNYQNFNRIMFKIFMK
jgi:hypothetical protein